MGRARGSWIFSAESSEGALAEEASLVATDVRRKQSELETDRPGSSFASVGHGRHAMAAEVGPREHERRRFAKTLVERLEAERTANTFERLVLVASPAFLGLLREHLGAPLQAQIALSIDKDYATLAPEEIRSRLPQRL